jgi:hypothetical protein
LSARRIPVTLAALVLAGAGCGGGNGTTTTRPVETADRAELPRSWSRHTNFDAGVSLGLPPNWRAKDRGIRTVAQSPDQLLAITVTTDRTDEAIAIEIHDWARRVADALPGFEELSGGSEPRPFEHPYPAVAFDGAEGDVGGPAKDLLLVALERDGLVKVTALAAWNSAKTPRGDIRTALRVLRTIRTRPVGG